MTSDKVTKYTYFMTVSVSVPGYVSYEKQLKRNETLLPNYKTL